MITEKEIEQYILNLRKEEIEFKKGVSNNINKENRPNLIKRIYKNFIFFGLSFIDFIILRINLLNSRYREKKIVYTAKNFTTTSNGFVEDRIIKPLFTSNIIFINQSKENYIRRINNQKVFNLGGVVKIASLLYYKKDKNLRLLKAYQLVNKWILGVYDYKEIYLLWFYDLNSLALSFSNYRNKLHLIEVQHGSIINYPPYKKKPPIKLIDEFYVKNQQTIQYLKDNFAKGYDCSYHLIPYPKSKRKIFEGVNILYASTVDFKGLHPVFVEFLKNNEIDNLKIQIRLHPRERTNEIENLFNIQMKNLNTPFVFDTSKNWLESNEIENLVVISPWSSSIEDAVDNGYKTIIIDPAGKERFAHLIDDINCFYSSSIGETIKNIL